jgi:hypothetical protein
VAQVVKCLLCKHEAMGSSNRTILVSCWGSRAKKISDHWGWGSGRLVSSCAVGGQSSHPSRQTMKQAQGETEIVGCPEEKNQPSFRGPSNPVTWLILSHKENLQLLVCSSHHQNLEQTQLGTKKPLLLESFKILLQTSLWSKRKLKKKDF